MRLVIAGAGGFLGSHLRRALATRGDEVTVLTRRPAVGPGQAAWDPSAGRLPDEAVFDGADAVVNLCGAGVGDRRWTPARKEILRSSRLHPTDLLARACARHRIPTLVSASAVGIYGDRGDELLDESAAPGTGFLARLCADWEAATAPAAAAGTRVVALRTGLVLGPDGGMLPRLRTLTAAFAGGRLGSGQQWWPWISVADHVSAMVFLLSHPELSGPVNVTAPTPVTNAAFTRELAARLRRPAPWVIPPVALRAALGGFADEILGGQRALPAALRAAGFRFLHADLRAALATYA